MAELQAQGIDAFGVQGDVRSFESCTAGAKAVHEHFGRLDFLINNAGISNPDHPVEPCLSTEVDMLKTVFETNVAGPMQVTQAFLPLFEKSEVKKLVFINSIAGSVGKMKAEKRTLALQYGQAQAEVV